VVEYAVLLGRRSLDTFGSFTHSAELWLSRINWELVGFAVLALVVVRIVAWAFKPRY
jgi:hypothetical protein